MALVKFDPWSRGLFRMMEDEDWPVSSESGLTSYETEDNFIVEANVAGVPVDEVDISVDRGVVTVKAEHEETKEEREKKKAIYREGRMAKYLYTTSIPCPVEADKAEAEVENGVVTVTIPKAPEAKPQKIKVKTKKS